MNVATEEETAELLPSRCDDDESYFIEYAIQKEIINRNRCTASRRLLGQNPYPDHTVNNSNHQTKVIITHACMYASGNISRYFYSNPEIRDDMKE